MTEYSLDLDSMPPVEASSRLSRLGEQIWTGFDGGKVLWHGWGDGPPLVLQHGGYGTRRCRGSKAGRFSATDTLARILRHVPARKATIWGEKDATAGSYLD